MSQTKTQLVEGLNINTSAPADALAVDNSGRIGVGTSTPSTGTSGNGNQLVLANAGSASSRGGMSLYNGNAGVGSIYFADTDSSTAGGIEYNHSANSMEFRVNDGVKAFINSSGRLGIGTSSPRLRTHIRGDAANAPTLGVASGSLIVGPNDDDYGMMFGVSASGWGWIQAQNFITPGNAYSLALQPSGGNVGIGTSSPSAKLQVNSGDIYIAARSGSTETGIFFRNPTDTATYAKIGYTDSTSNLVLGTTNNYSTVFISNNTERVKIFNDGRVEIGQVGGPSGAISSTGFRFMEGQGFWWSTTGANSYWNVNTTTYFNFRYNGSGSGSIVIGNGSTSYNTSSDYRMKENVVDLDGAITRLKQLEPKRFNFIATPERTVDGFLAHEVQTVVPEAISGVKDQVEVWTEDEDLPDGVSVGDNKLDEDGNTIPLYQGIDQAKLVPLLTAALQEAIAKIETLETANASLEARLTALEGA